MLGDKIADTTKEIKKKITENEEKIYNLKPMLGFISTGIFCIIFCIIGFFYRSEKLYMNFILLCFGFGSTMVGLWYFIVYRKCLKMNAILKKQLNGRVKA